MRRFILRLRAGLIIAAVLGAGLLGFEAARITGSSSAESPGAAPPNPAAAEEVILPDDSLVTMQILLTPVVVGPLNEEIEAPATVVAFWNGEASVTAHARGTVLKIDKHLGDEVTAGSRLALVESADGSAMASEVRIAESDLTLADSALARERSLYAQRVTARQDLEDAEARAQAAAAAARRARAAASAAHVSGDGRFIAIVSPIAGRITAGGLMPGAYVEPEREVFRIADAHRVLIEAAVAAEQALQIAPGDAASVVTATNAVVDARVLSVTPTLNAETRSATVVLSPLPGQSLPSIGEIARARIAIEAARSNALIVPADAIQNLDGREVAFVRKPDGFRIQEVAVGVRNRSLATILSGLKSGDVVASTNAFLLKAQIGKNAEDDSE